MHKPERYQTLLAEERSKDGCLYRYRLLARKENETVFYSIAADMKNHKNEESCAMVYDVFQNYDEACDFFYRLVLFLATPKNLPYVVEDELLSIKKA